MESIGDIHNFGDQFKYQLDKLNEADIEERDRKAIREPIRYQDTQRGLAATTNVNNCPDLRLSAERADTALVDMEHSARHFYLTSKDRTSKAIVSGELSSPTQCAWIAALRQFVRFLVLTEAGMNVSSGVDLKSFDLRF